MSDPHTGLHSEQGALSGEHPARARDPIIKAHDLAWLEFTKPDLRKSEEFGTAFGFTTALRTADELQLRGTDPGAPCVLIRKGPRERFLGPAFRAADARDVLRLADKAGTTVTRLPESLGGVGTTLIDPSGWRLFFRTQARNPEYLKDGNVVEIAIGTDDGKLDLGRQRTVVRA